MGPAMCHWRDWMSGSNPRTLQSAFLLPVLKNAMTNPSRGNRLKRTGPERVMVSTPKTSRSTRIVRDDPEEVPADLAEAFALGSRNELVDAPVGSPEVFFAVAGAALAQARRAGTHARAKMPRQLSRLDGMRNPTAALAQQQRNSNAAEHRATPLGNGPEAGLGPPRGGLPQKPQALVMSTAGCLALSFVTSTIVAVTITAMSNLPSRTHMLLLVALVSVGCGSLATSYRIVQREPGTEQKSRYGFVILINQDQDAPSRPPENCARLGQAEVRANSDKIYAFDEFRSAARELGGNAVADIERVSSPQARPLIFRGTLLRCKFFDEDGTNTQKTPTPL